MPKVRPEKHNPTTLFIGANVFDHDSSVYMVLPEKKDIIALPTERVTRVKHDKMLFFPALEKALENKGIDAKKVQRVFLGHSFTSSKKESFRKNEYHIQKAERKHFGITYVKDLEITREEFKQKSTFKKITSLLSTHPGRSILLDKILEKTHLQKRVDLETLLKCELGKIFTNAEIEVHLFDHQECHAVSSYYTSPFEKALSISYDGWGDDYFSRAYVVENGDFTLVSSSACPFVTVSATEYPRKILGSPGGIYAYVTHLLGFKPLSEEGKIEALAAYAKPDEGLYEMFMDIFSLDKETHSLVCNAKLAEATISTAQMRNVIATLSRETVSASVQKFLEDVSVPYVRHLVEHTGVKNVCLSGGATANVIMNLNIFENITKNIHVTPAMADDGTAQGAVLLLLKKHGFSQKDLTWLKGESMPYHGTSYSRKDVMLTLKDFEEKIESTVLGPSWPKKVAGMVVEGKVGALFQGKMEWGPRALGNRSIIADPTRPEFRDKINKTIKRRPLFQPFCPSMLAEERERLFEDAYLNKHMTCAFRMKKEYWEKLPSAIHVDGTARVQFVSKTDNEQYYELLREVKKKNGYGVVINTSFNKHGRTIVETPRDAIVDFLDTDMDYVVIEGILITRK